MFKLFESTEINGMKLPNRFVRSATWEGMTIDKGACTQERERSAREVRD